MREDKKKLLEWEKKPDKNPFTNRRIDIDGYTFLNIEIQFMETDRKSVV